jgi:methylglyoxal reductase
LQKRVLGKSGLAVGEIGIGCWAIGGPDWNLGMPMGWEGVDDENSLRGLQAAVDMGANHFDTADVYGHGHSERILGRLLKTTNRSDLVIGTKVGYFRGTAPHSYHPLNMRNQLETSLSNLGTEYVDIYYFHNLNFGTTDEYLDDAVAAMVRFKEQGKVRVIGQRGPHIYAPDRLKAPAQSDDKYERFLNVTRVICPEVIQVRFNMLTPWITDRKRDIFSWAERHDVGVVINKPLGQGLLLDKYDPLHPPVFGAGDHRSRKSWFGPKGLHILRGRLAQIKARFGSTLPDMVRVALQYCLAATPNGCVVAGFKDETQVAMNLAAAGRDLSTEEVEFVRSVMAGIGQEVGSFFVGSNSK